jgi:DNA-damage-inducible protein J
MTSLPFEIKAPNTTTRDAIAELEAGKGERFTSTGALMADLNADDGTVVLIPAR